VLVGAGTVRADDPELTCRIPRGRNPVRVVLAGARLDLPARARVLDVRAAPTWVVAPAAVDPTRTRRLQRRGVVLVGVPGRRGEVAPAALLRALAARGLTSVLVEGGARVGGDLLRAGLVDRIVWFVAPSLLGADGVPAVGPLAVRRAADAFRLTDVDVARLGRDVVVTASVRPPKGRPPFASGWPPR
jgi:diaminohydroxyphosphoribosylaminopyrimidine deaminase/5-amino-6-(5-phosphoribosylamino)uracil reductase